MASISSYTNVSLVQGVHPLIGSMSNITSAQILANYIEPINNEIDMALSKRYTIPLSAGAPFLTTIATRMAAFDLLSIRGMAQHTEKGQQVNPFWSRLKDARQQLKDIQEGKVELLDSSGAPIAERTDIVEAWSNTMDYHPTMHEGRWTETIRDEDKLDDIANDRDLESDVTE